jgi:hypothetical protein
MWVETYKDFGPVTDIATTFSIPESKEVRHACRNAAFGCAVLGGAAIAWQRFAIPGADPYDVLFSLSAPLWCLLAFLLTCFSTSCMDRRIVRLISISFVIAITIPIVSFMPVHTRFPGLYAEWTVVTAILMALIINITLLINVFSIAHLNFRRLLNAPMMSALFSGVAAAGSALLSLLL